MMPEQHHCDHCGEEFKCCGLMAGVPGHCLCEQEIGEVQADNGVKKRRLLLFCGYGCREDDTMDLESGDDDEMCNFEPKAFANNKRKL